MKRNESLSNFIYNLYCFILRYYRVILPMLYCFFLLFHNKCYDICKAFRDATRSKKSIYSGGLGARFFVNLRNFT